MADLDSLKYVTIWKLPTREGATATESRDWLPVTHIDKIRGRITVKAPYPIGDYDVVTTESKECETCEGLGYLQKEACPKCNDTHYMECPVCHGRKTVGCDTQELCAYCGGSGVVPCETCYSGAKEFWVPTNHCTGNDCIPCPDCNGTGYAGGSGVISVTPEGIITLRYDSVTLGITDDGKLFARLKVKSDGGIGITEDDELFVKVDESTIRLVNGQLTAVYKPTTMKVSGEADTVEQQRQRIDTALVVTDESVKRVHAFLTLDLHSLSYETAASMYNITVSLVAGRDGAVNVPFKPITWDLTVPYTMLNFDTIIDNIPYGYEFYVQLDCDENMPDGNKINWSMNVVSC